MISALELCLQGLAPDELVERAASIDRIVRDGHGLLRTDETGSVVLVDLRPAPTLPPLMWPGLA
jgi:hypothetical protein